MKIRTKLFCALAALSMLATPGMASAQTYPSETLTIVVAYPPGGFNDLVARLIAEDFSERLGATVVVDNRPGGGTVVGTDVVAKAAADGYTIGISPFAFAVNPGLFPDLPYDTATDFDHVIVLGEAFNVLATHPDFEANTVAELVEHARQNPGALNYASAGNGSSNHLSGELFNHLADIETVHIPYGGSAPARTDLVAGRVDFMFDNYTNFVELVAAGELKALGITLQEESDLMPGVQPVSEVLDGYEVTTWWGVIAPAGIPEDVLGTLNAALNEFLKGERALEAFGREGVEPIGGTPEEARAYVERQMERWIPVAQEVEMTVD